MKKNKKSLKYQLFSYDELLILFDSVNAKLHVATEIVITSPHTRDKILELCNLLKKVKP